jgi:hypothetical protein
LTKAGRSSRAADAGFSTVEILVLLALASLALLAVGGLQYAAIGYLDAQERGARIQNALFELQSAGLQLSEGPGLLQDASAAGFVLYAPDSMASGERGEFGEVRLDEATRSLTVQLLKSSTSIDLSAFTAATLEYLTDDGEVPDWVFPVASGQAIAARLVLWDGSVAWRPMIWSRSPLSNGTVQ